MSHHFLYEPDEKTKITKMFVSFVISLFRILSEKTSRKFEAMMNQIPESLRQLWASRDRVTGQRKVSLESIDEFLPDTPAEPKPRPVISQTPLTRDVAPLPNLSLFPTYTLTLPSVSLASYHVRTNK